MCIRDRAQREYGCTSNRAMARQLSASVRGRTNHRPTSRRGVPVWMGRSSAVTPRAATASTEARTWRTAAPTVVPVPSGTASPARTSPSASLRTASAPAARARTGAIRDCPSGPMAPMKDRSISSRPRGSTTVAQPVCASSSRRWRAMATRVTSATRAGPPERKAASYSVRSRSPSVGVSRTSAAAARRAARHSRVQAVPAKAQARSRRRTQNMTCFYARGLGGRHALSTIRTECCRYVTFRFPGWSGAARGRRRAAGGGRQRDGLAGRGPALRRLVR